MHNFIVDKLSHFNGSKHTAFKRSWNSIDLDKVAVAAIFILFLIFNMSIPLTGTSDDGILFAGPLMKSFDGNFFAFLSNRYSHWSSRIIIEFFTLLSVRHGFFWRIINTCSLTAMSVIPVYIFSFKTRKSTLLMLSTSLVLMMPTSMFAETGWIATTTNYSWVLAAFLGFLVIVLKPERKMRWLSWVFSLFLVAYSSNLEQMCVVLIVVIPIIAFYFYRSKWWLLAPHYLIVLSNLALIYFCKGNKIRYAKEVANRFPDFTSLSIFRKIEMGYSSSLKSLFFDGHILFLVLALTLFFALSRSSLVSKQFIGSVPLVSFLIFNLFSGLFHTKLKIIDIVLGSFNKYGTSFKLLHPTTWMADLVMLFIATSIIVSIAFILKSEPRKFLAVLLMLSLAFITKLVLAFSPTIWASGERTGIFLFYAVGITALTVLAKRDTSKMLQGTILSLGAFCYLGWL